jgi:aryl-alcohol dehydrogenase-like predicted oxidoreductase
MTISVDPPSVAPPEADARTIALLQRARGLGVTTFDVTTARTPERAERLIARAFPGPDPEVSVVVARSIDSLSRERTIEGEPISAANVSAAIAASIDQSRRRLAPVPVGVVEWLPSPDQESENVPYGVAGQRLSLGAPEPLWALRLSPRESPLPESAPEPALFTGSFSLLEPEIGSRFEARGTPPTAFLIARDAFSEGRLDGSRFAHETGLAGPGSPPVDIRRLHQEFDPVLRLGFLTSGHRRTLAQAALQFVLHWPWVASVVVPLPTPERFEEVLGFFLTPPISSDELAQIRALK